jgi:hypothetical protein
MSRCDERLKASYCLVKKKKKKKEKKNFEA